MPTPKLRRYTRHGTLLQLVAFETTARLGSCSRAAEALHLSQPAISSMNKKLTESVGLPLLVSNNKRLEPTEAGKEIVKMARQMQELLQQLDDKLEPIRELEQRRRQYADAFGAGPLH